MLLVVIALLIVEITIGSHLNMSSHGNVSSDSTSTEGDIGANEAISSDPFLKNAVTKGSAPRGIIPVIIFCHARPQYLSRTLESVFSKLPKWTDKFSLFISQDGDDAQITKILSQLAAQQKAYWLQFDYESTEKKVMKGFEGQQWRAYHKISAHYKWALNMSE